MFPVGGTGRIAPSRVPAPPRAGSGLGHGELTIDGDTVFGVADAETEATLAELQDGRVEGTAGETAAALYVGVVDGGEGTAEIVAEDVSVERS